MEQKKNILIIGSPSYAVLDYMEQVFLDNSIEYNFYIITDDMITKHNLHDKYQEFKEKQIIKNYFFIQVIDLNSLALIKKKICSLKKVKKIYSEVENIEFHKIFCSNFYFEEFYFLIKKFKKKGIEIIGINFANFKIKKNIIYPERSILKIIKNNISIKNNLNILKYIFFKSLDLILYFLVFREYYNFFLKKLLEFKEKVPYFSVYSSFSNLMITDKEYEALLYKKNIKNFKFSLIKNKEIELCKCENVAQKKLLVVFEYIKSSDHISKSINHYVEKIKIISEKFDSKMIVLKHHPRDDSGNVQKLNEELTKLNFNAEIFDQKKNIYKNICDFYAVLGCSSTVLNKSTTLCKNVVTFGMLYMGNLLRKNPGPKEMIGDIYDLSSGVIWIEDFKNFKTLNKKEIYKISKQKRFSRFNYFNDYKEFDYFFRNFS